MPVVVTCVISPLAPTSAGPLHTTTTSGAAWMNLANTGDSTHGCCALAGVTMSVAARIAARAVERNRRIMAAPCAKLECVLGRSIAGQWLTVNHPDTLL